MIFYCLISVLIGIKRNVLGYKAVIRNRKTKDRQYNRKGTNKMTYKTLHRKLKTEQHTA